MKSTKTIVACVLLLLASPAVLHAADAHRPNVVIFLTDDTGYGDLACYGNPIIRTPNLDHFAGQGMRFTQGYAACAVCSPSRSAIQTGRTPYRNGVYNWIHEGSPMHLRRSEITIATLLHGAGYATCHVGKWHLNGLFNSPEQPQPNDHGYDWWLATQNNAHPTHVNPDNFIRNGKPAGKLEGYSAELVVNEAIDWLKHHRDPAKPFLLNVCTHETHQPVEAADRFHAMYSQYDDSHSHYYGDASQMDAAFGTLMKALEELGVANDTLVFFTSDNGPEGDGSTKRCCGSTGGLRGRKRSTYEGGIREAFMVRWPGHVAPGATCDQPVIGSDIFTTICAATGVAPPADRIIDGTNILPAFENRPLDRKIPLYWRCPICPGPLKMAMREGDWKLLASPDLKQCELYNLKNDVQETTDQAAKEPQRLEQMRSTMAALVAEMAKGAPDWGDGERTPATKPARSKARREAAKQSPPGPNAAEDFAVVESAEVTKADDGYVVSAAGEGFVLKKLEHPAAHQAKFRLTYQAATAGSTRNACFVFGADATNAALVKAGSMIGLHKHGIFQGPWSRMKDGKTVAAGFATDQKFDATVTVDLDRRVVTLVVDDTTVEAALPADVKQLNFIGYYVKGTAAAFGPIQVVEQK